jgi:hypothetical protein
MSLFPRVTTRIASVLVASLALVACGRTVTMTGTADEVWADTLETLRIQGIFPESIQPGLDRPRIDRAAGEIDLPYAESVYYGEGAAFLQVDIGSPRESHSRSIRMWVDYPVGMTIVRFGRAINEKTSSTFQSAFEAAYAELLTRRERDVAESIGADPVPTTPAGSTP